MTSNNQQSEHPLAQYNAYCNSLNVDLDKLPKYEDWLEEQVIRLQARIDAAAAIEPQSTEDTEDDSYLWNSGYNTAFYEFRNALGLGASDYD